jgi:hypothetical protein
MPPFLPLATALRHHIHAPASFSAPDSQVTAFLAFSVLELVESSRCAGSRSPNKGVEAADDCTGKRSLWPWRCLRSHQRL